MQKNTVCLTMEDAKQIYELFNACALADLYGLSDDGRCEADL